MSTVAHGTAENLARLCHFRALDLPEAHELDPVIRHFLGAVTDPAEVIEHLHDELDQLWSLITEDFDDDQLDELTEADWERLSFACYQQEADHRHGLTRERLARGIESYVRMAREWHAQEQRHNAGTGAAA